MVRARRNSVAEATHEYAKAIKAGRRARWWPAFDHARRPHVEDLHDDAH